MSTPRRFDVHAVRADFPVLKRQVHGKPLVYLDNAATAQKPNAVLDCISTFYGTQNANIHRGVHLLSVEATDLYDGARIRIAEHLKPRNPAELIFVKGTTEALNLIASSWGRTNLHEGDEILLTEMEHHANIVPWQLIAEEVGATIRVAPISDEGELILEEFEALLSPKTRLAAFTHTSNVLGTVNPVAKMCEFCRERGIISVIDGAQATPHAPPNLVEIGCDFYVFSGHKVYGPDGIGILYGRSELLNEMPPYQGGGDMIERVSFEKTTFKAIPERFEAGTPNISGAIGLAAAFDYLAALGWDNLAKQEQTLLEAGTAALQEIQGLQIQGCVPGKASVISFTIDGAHPHDIGTILDTSGVAIRAGHHCAQPLMKRMGAQSTARASFSFYNTLEEVEVLAEAVRKAQRFFG